MLDEVIELASRLNLTLVGFARLGRINVYSAADRIAAGAAVKYLA